MKKRLSLLLCAVLTAALLIGCTGPVRIPDTTPAVTETQTETEAVTESPEPDPDADGLFSFAVMPDTQGEVRNTYHLEKKSFRNRCEWLIENREALDLRAVLHTGDMVNCASLAPDQLAVAADGMYLLHEAGIPMALALGNHDTGAVGPDGSAKSSATRTEVRETEHFNATFPIDMFPDFVPYEEGKIDNGYQILEAGGVKWMLLSLELWVRLPILKWAEEVIAANSDCNVVIITHSFLKGDGKIYGGNGGYGEMHPTYMWVNIFKKYENLKMILCGHTGSSAVHVDYGEAGNKVAMILGCFHSNEANPVRILEIDTKNGTIRGKVHIPLTESTWDQYDFFIEDMAFVGAEPPVKAEAESGTGTAA